MDAAETPGKPGETRTTSGGNRCNLCATSKRGAQWSQHYLRRCVAGFGMPCRAGGIDWVWRWLRTGARLPPGRAIPPAAQRLRGVLGAGDRLRNPSSHRLRRLRRCETLGLGLGLQACFTINFVREWYCKQLEVLPQGCFHIKNLIISTTIELHYEPFSHFSTPYTL